MGSGTMVKVYASRIHRSNAVETLEEAKRMKNYIERTLIAMGAARGEIIDGCSWYEHVAREVPSLLEEYADASFKETAASIIIDCPEDAEDDYDNDGGL
jgi:hypothetical protein